MTALVREPNWDFWRKMDEWTVNQAICLLLRVDPKCFFGRAIAESRQGFPSYFNETHKALWEQAKELRELAWASHSKGKLRITNHISLDGFGSPPDLAPCDWLFWACSKNLPIPPELEDLVPESVPAVEREKTLGTRERETLLLLVVGLAIKGFDYDSRARRSEVVGQITASLQGLGIEISEDTIREKLKEGTKLLPK